MADIYKLVYTHPDLLKLIDDLQVNQVLKDLVHKDALSNPTREEIRKAAWLASILASSQIDEHKQRAQILAKLISMHAPDDIEISKVCYVIFSRTGNLLAAKFLKNVFVNVEVTEDDLRFREQSSVLLDFELATKRQRNFIKTGRTEFSATDFQIQLWNSLSQRVSTSISAPTSGGKSHIIQYFIEKCFSENEVYKAIYIVPTKALIGQVTQSFRNILHEDVMILTGVSDSRPSDQITNKVLYVLTPERCMRLLQMGWSSTFYPNFVFVDEIQNIERSDSRGHLLEFVLREISQIWPLAQINIAGPMILKLSELYSEITGMESRSIQTDLSPVFQIKVAVKSWEGNKLCLWIYTRKDHFVEVKLNAALSTKKLFSKTIGHSVSDITLQLAGNDQSIIYAPRGDYAEDWCKRMVALIRERKDNRLTDNEAVLDLCKFIIDEIHPMYFLSEFLKYGVAFHHGKLPEIIREEVEDLFSAKHIQFLICTSTLLEGVNLPVKKIFIPYPKKNKELLSKFDFGNLIGRAGRIRDSSYGIVVGVQTSTGEKNNANWTDEYFTSTGNKELSTSVKTSINEGFSKIQSGILGELSDFDNQDISNSIIFLRLKALQGEKALSSYLNSKLIDQNKQDRLIQLLIVNVSSISLDVDIIKLNPTIDPLLQDKLFKKILTEGIEDWIVTSNNMSYMSFEESKKLPMGERSMYQQLVHVFVKLDEVFNLERETYLRYQISMRIGQMVIYAFNWMRGYSLGELIKKDLDFYASHSNPKRRIKLDNKDQVNERINSVIKIHASVVSFILVKYIKVCTDILSYVMTEEQREQFSFCLSLPTKIELGTLDSVASTFISAGIPRNLAIKISRLVPKDEKDEPLLWLKRQRSLSISKIYIKHLRRLNLLASIN